MAITADQVVTQKHKRIFIQDGGALPGNTVRYAGQDAQYMSIEGVSAPVRGSIEAIRVHDPRRPGAYKIIGFRASSPDLATFTLRVLERHGSIPFPFKDLTCAQSFYVPTGNCKDLSDFGSGWSDYVEIYSGVQFTDVGLGDRTSFEDDNSMEDELDATVTGGVYAVGQLSFGTNAAALIDREVRDVVYYSSVQCGDCGPANDGTKWIYAVTESSGAGSPGLPSELIYSTDGGGSWDEAAIDGIGASEDALAVDVAGDKLIVLGTDALYWATINTNTGVPGSFTKVTDGFDAAGSPNDVFVSSPSAVFFVGDGGYIYKATDVTSGVSTVSEGGATSENLQRIHGDYVDTLLAVGENGAIVVSTNAGDTWATTTTTPASDTIQAVAVLGEFVYWVGSDAGEVYYSIDGGETWTIKGIASGVDAVHDIVFATPEAGYVAYTESGPVGKVSSTWNGGANWTNTTPRITNLPAVDRINRIATPVGIHPTTAANYLTAAGLADDGTDGVLLQASSAIV